MANYNSSYTGIEIDRVIGYGINVTSDIQVQINSKEPTLTKGNLTEATSAILTITGGTSSIIGSGTTIEVQQANGSQSGYITSADWTTFNNKQATITGGASTITTLDLTSDRVLISSGTGKVAISSITTTTLGYLDASSSIQTQLNAKEPTLTKGDLTEATSSVLTITGGTNSQIGSGTSIEVQQATTSTSGYLSDTDWNTFNNKQNALTINNIEGTTNQVSVANGTNTIIGSSAVTLSLPQNIHTGASPSFNNLYLTGLTANRAIATDGSKLLVSLTTTDTELEHVSGVTSPIQTQLDSKQNNLDFSDLQGTTNQVTVDYGTNVLVGATPVTLSLPQNINTSADVTFNGLNLGGLTANRAIVTDGSKNIISSSATATEVGYLSGLTGNIQDQIDSKEPDFDTTNITGTTNQVNVSFGTDVVIGSTPVDLSLPQDIDTSANVNFANLNLSALTAQRALIINASNDIASSVTTNTELSYVNGVTSSIQTQLDSKQKELYKTVDASGNGDYLTLKEAIDANETAIFIKNGTYLESTPITIDYDNVSIIGENIEGTILQFGAGEDGIRLYANYSEIKNLTMDALTEESEAALVIGDGQSGGNPDTSIGNHNWIDHCRIVGSSDIFAVYIAGASYLAGTPTLQAFESNDLQYNNRVTNCILESNWNGDSFSFSLQKDGEFSNNYCSGGRIAFYMCRDSDCCNNSVVDSGSNGIFVGCPAYSNNVNGNRIYNSTASAFKIQNQLEHTPLLDNQRAFSNNFNDNVIFESNNSGFEITGDADHEPKNNNFNDNTIYKPDNHGFYLQDAQLNNFVGNTVYQPRTDSGTYSRGSGFYMVQNVENNNINGNIILDERDPYVLHTAIGNREGTDCPNNNVVGNKIVANNTERSIWVQSNGWNISNNYVSGGYYAGIYLDQADNCNVSGNICENNTNQANNAYYEIWLTNTANNNIITNNTCISSASNIALGDITVSSGTGNIIENNIGIGTTNEYATILSGLQDMGTSTGIVTQTGNTSFSKRTITGTTNEIEVSNGDGVSGNPTISLPTNVYIGAGTLGRDVDNIIDFSTDNQIALKTNSVNALTIDSSQNTSLVGKMTISTSLGDSTGEIELLTDNSLIATQFHWVTNSLATNMGSNSNIIHIFGQSDTLGNAGYIGFNYTSDDSASNYLTLGLFGYDHLLKIYKSGNVDLSGIVSFGNQTNAQQLLLYSSGNFKYGFGIQTNELRTFFPNNAGFHTWGTIDTTDGTTYSELMRLTKDGQIGISTTDIETWNPSYVAIEFSKTSIMAHSSDESIFINNNCYFATDSTWKYKATDITSKYAQAAGTHIFSVASSGTADTTITWTDALTIDNSGDSVFAGDITINKAGGDYTNPLLAINATNDLSFQIASLSLNPNLTSGNRILHMIGQATSNGNLGYMGFSYTGNDSASNYLTLGIFGNDDLFTIDKSGNGALTGSLEVGGATNNVTLDSTKGVRQNGTTTTWDDLKVPLTQSKQGTVSKPDFDYTNVGYLFPQNDATEILYFIVQMPHAWKEGSTIYPHVHWQQSATPTVTYKIDYKWFNVNSTVPAGFTTLNIDQTVFQWTTGNLHQITTTASGIDGTGKTLSSILLVKLYRDDNDYTGDALAFEMDFHYEIDSLGSDQEFTKT